MRIDDESVDIAANELEFRSAGDDAWYSVRLVVEGETLTVKFFDFPQSADQKFIAADFRNLGDLDEFIRRFRPVSVQLQDKDCSTVKGLSVCASFEFESDEVRFYDALVEAVHHEEHSFANEDEECMCTFVLCWLHGPNWGNLTSAKIANICLVQLQSAEQLDSGLASFAKMAKEKIQVASGLQETECFEEFGSAAQTTEGSFYKCYENTDQDGDLGGRSFNRNGTQETGVHHFILIENLEKDLSPVSIMTFIRKQTTISPLAYVFPSLPTDTYTRAAIVLDCKKEHKSVYQFLDNPDHIIASRKGRPWVVSEKSYGTFRPTLASLLSKSQSKIRNIISDDELKIIHSGSEEYKTATRLRDLYKDFVDHQKRLHWRLGLEESKILQLKD